MRLPFALAMAVLFYDGLVKDVDHRRAQAHASHFALALVQFVLAIDHKKLAVTSGFAKT
jgi:hypothetical protein